MYASLSVCLSVLFSPLYLVNEWIYFTETDLLAGSHDTGDIEPLFQTSKAKVSVSDDHRNLVNALAPKPLDLNQNVHRYFH